ncbi:hypothetical protein K469DRAFT_685045 [Zopfia rhizophila CBS 207.26]|uniref:Heterokaryon incompatibility domain-containing protein n=1 Tax=Zopfia rhizophila CBS 207.26 TaxID=1314779 RepID=A0A6A6E941_9PEZI|nr:hypothetical protein K469DRAFT_685045 [Zopfia rhizophila CBS 207.26]
MVWLGVEENGSMKALGCFSKWNKRRHAVPPEQRTFEVSKNFMRSLLEDPLNEESWEAFFAFVERPWYKRLWVVQNFIFAARTEMLCEDLIPDHEVLGVFTWVVYTILHSGEFRRSASKNINDIWK